MIVILVGSCNKTNGLTQEQELRNINELFNEINDLAANANCDNANEWHFTDYGSKACGGPVGYIAYSTTIDTVLFFQKIEEHRSLQHAYNVRWKIISDCSVPLQPTRVICDNGHPVFEY